MASSSISQTRNRCLQNLVAQPIRCLRLERHFSHWASPSLPLLVPIDDRGEEPKTFPVKKRFAFTLQVPVMKFRSKTQAGTEPTPADIERAISEAITRRQHDVSHSIKPNDTISNATGEQIQAFRALCQWNRKSRSLLARVSGGHHHKTWPPDRRWEFRLRNPHWQH